MNKKKETIKAITEGAIYTALYALIALLTRYLITGTDSFLYYLIPVPIAIYSARNKLQYSLSVVLASIVLSLLFANPLYVLMLIMPNILIGWIFGIIEIKLHHKIINYIIVFILCLLADFLSIYAFEKIMGIGYWDDTIEFITKIFGSFNFDTSLVKKTVSSLSVVVLMLDSIIKELFINMVFALIVLRLKLIKDYKPTYKIPITYNPLIAGIYIVLLILFSISLFYMFNSTLIVAQIIFIILFTIIFIFSFYLIYQFMIYFKLKNMKVKTLGIILVTLSAMIFFPITIFYSLILNIINWK